MKNYVLITTEPGTTAEVAEAISHVRDVTHLDAVAGPFDLIVRAETNGFREMTNVVLRAIQAIPGVERTLTCPVMREVTDSATPIRVAS